MAEIKLVKQEGKCGCVIACLAMVLGKTYREIESDFWNDFEEQGIDLEKTADYLSDCNYSVIQKEVTYYNTAKFGRDELLKPFAPVHLVRIRPKFDADVGHLVVMDENGELFCPSEGSPVGFAAGHRESFA